MERKSPRANLMAVSVNTKGVVKSTSCLHSLVVEVRARIFLFGKLVSFTPQGTDTFSEKRYLKVVKSENQPLIYRSKENL